GAGAGEGEGDVEGDGEGDGDGNGDGDEDGRVAGRDEMTAVDSVDDPDDVDGMREDNAAVEDVDGRLELRAGEEATKAMEEALDVGVDEELEEASDEALEETTEEELDDTIKETPEETCDDTLDVAIEGIPNKAIEEPLSKGDEVMLGKGLNEPPSEDNEADVVGEIKDELNDAIEEVPNTLDEEALNDATGAAPPGPRDAATPRPVEESSPKLTDAPIVDEAAVGGAKEDDSSDSSTPDTSAFIDGAIVRIDAIVATEAIVTCTTDEEPATRCVAVECTVTTTVLTGKLHEQNVWAILLAALVWRVQCQVAFFTYAFLISAGWSEPSIAGGVWMLRLEVTTTVVLGAGCLVAQKEEAWASLARGASIGWMPFLQSGMPVMWQDAVVMRTRVGRRKRMVLIVELAYIGDIMQLL
ncbi:hypothetical protein J1614_011653, partial [Plenodomus biglobosus]